MNIYLLEQNDITGYDTYDSCVVIAENENNAKLLHPCSFNFKKIPCKSNYNWTNNPDRVKVTLLGISNKQEESVICSSFNAG